MSTSRRITLGLFAALCCSAPALAADPPAKAPAALSNETKTNASYAIGHSNGMGFRRAGLRASDVDVQAFLKGLIDGLAGTKGDITDEQRQAALKAVDDMLSVRGPELTRQEGEVFLADNKKKEGVKTTASGLQYKVLKSGTGATPKATDTVSTHYRGTLLDGSEFDSSHKRGMPAEFEVGGVIKGWTEALQLMKVGDKWQLFIPAHLAYGERGTPGGPIGPNSTLIFEIELLGINK